MSVLIKNPTTVVGKGAVVEKIDVDSLNKVEPSRFVDKIYLNKDLNDERMMELISQINYYNLGGFNGVFLFLNIVYAPIELTNQAKTIAIVKLQIEDFLLGHMIILLQGENLTPIWFSQQLYDFTHQEGVGDELDTPFGTVKVDKAGWSNITDYIFISAFCSSSLDGMPIGADNELLKIIFSTTPFVYYKKELKGSFNGDTLQANVGGEYFDGKTVDVEKMLDNKKLPLNIDVEYAKIKVDDTEVDLIGEYDGTTISVNKNVDMQSLINEGKIPLSIEVPSGGLVINGLIKEYQVLAGENISAGDFIEFINNKFKQLNNYSPSCPTPPSCILLEENKVFIAHAYYSYRRLYGTIVEINGTTMTVKTAQLNSDSNSCYHAPSCILLEQNKVFIAHAYSNSYYLYGTIVEINGTAMTPTTTQLNSDPNSCYDAPSCILLENNKVFIAHAYSGSRYLYGTIVEINGTTMTATATQLNSDTKRCQKAPSCILLEQNKVFIAHSTGSYNALYITIVEINGIEMTVTITTSFSLDVYSCNYAPSCILLENNKVFIAHAYSNSYYLYGTIVEINGTTVTHTTTQLNSKEKSCINAPSCILLENNKVFIAHVYSGDKHLYETIVEINGTEMTHTTTQLNSDPNSCNHAPSCCLVDTNKVFIAHSYTSSSYLGGTIYFEEKAIPYETTISGVAKQSGVGGDTIQVYVPNEE